MFSDWLREARKALDLTQRELAALVGMSPSALGMYEQGRRVPGRRARERLEGFFAARGMEMPPPPPVNLWPLSFDQESGDLGVGLLPDFFSNRNSTHGTI